MRPQFQIGLLFLLAFAFYLPGLQSGYFIFDDFSIVEVLRQRGLEAIRLFPAEGARYLRPLLMLSFWVDIYLWGAHPGLMHLENLLLHAVNASLVFVIVRSLVDLRARTRGQWLPLLAAVLFLLHPIVTESVNWIAGRSDPLAGLFVLIGFWLLVRVIGTGKVPLAFAAGLAFFLGSLVKEVAFFALPGAILVVLFYRYENTGKRRSWAWRFRCCLPLLLGILGYTILRTRLFSLFDYAVPQAVTTSNVSMTTWPSKLFEAVTSFGFYFKKLLFPYPLNFAIDQVSPLYIWIGVAGLALLARLLTRRNHQAAILLFMSLFILPAVLNALFSIAWTAYAERYLYLPAAFLSIALSAIMPVHSLGKYVQGSLIGLMLISFLPLTLYRNMQWQQPFNILADARIRNPDNLTLHNNYAILLTDQAGPEAGRREFRKILARVPANQEARSNLARIALILQDDPAQAHQDLAVYFSGDLQPNAETKNLMQQVKESCLSRKLDCE